MEMHEKYRLINVPYSICKYIQYAIMTIKQGEHLFNV